MSNPDLSNPFFRILSPAIFLSRPVVGWASVVVSADPAGRLARKILLSVVLIPTLVGWMVTRGSKSGFYDPDFDSVLRLICSVVLFLAVIWRNVTEIRKSDQELQTAYRQLQEQRTYFETVFSSLPDAAFVADRDRVIMLVNPAAEKVFNGRREIYLRQSTRKIYENPADFETLGRTIFNPDTSIHDRHTVEARFKRADGRSFEGELTASILRDPKGEVMGYVGIIRDITQRNQAQVELKKTIERLEEERGLRERFVTSLTHDLRNPLSAASALTQLASLRFEAENRGLGPILSKIRGCLDRVDRMMRNLLDASRIRAGQPIPLRLEPCDLKKIIDQAVDGMKAIHGDRFVVKAEEGIEGVWDFDAILRVLENLVVNAVKYGNSDTPIVLRAEHRNGSAWLAVHNQGRPISDEDQAELFQPFVRASDAELSGKRGWGIGLSLVRAIAEAHGGNVQLKSAQGRGTTFIVTLPAARVRVKRA